jgi:hypothetical protein
VDDIVYKWNRESWIKMQCLWDQGLSHHFLLLISLPLCHQWTQIHLTLASHHFLFHLYHLHLITFYFTPPLASMDKKSTHYYLVKWHMKSLSLVCMKPISPISNWSKRVLSISNILFNDPWFSTMIKKHDNMEIYIWHIDIS